MSLEKDISEKFEGKYTEKIFSPEHSVKIAPLAVSKSISIELGLDQNYVERVAFKQGAVPERYARNLTTFSQKEQEKLFTSKVAVVGLGGLGGHLLESLARAGVGHIVACDGDVFEASNLNRQLLATENTLGQSKADAAYELIRKVNPAVFLDVKSEYLEAEQFEGFIKGADVVVDCLGGLKHRGQLKDAAAKLGIPLVTASVAGWAGIVSTVYPGDPSPSDFFGNNNGLEELLGTPVSAISTAVGVQSAEVLKILSGKGAGLTGKAFMFDLAGLYFDVVTL
ncbi:Molybdopterin or thiamine biosynthesis adenylyltransferase [Maridesulfovibrio ferrireducens]|uniref:Molybdopterin or thiamine biosynthesis adenylyltransferase n=1 Tax=Maridesulfovibrio ferrireducens TaxID=246191 RepID=A0A1G9FB02_9BACT|nr:HesA/MoeB/ThiF family protein [Maridesulfovibrio ferrireducens]SDK85508.1 Molybdopterin or thiamine biosynthesis adenylyltransferase [Maridesulfovibrio ferrireducens]